MLTFRVCRWAAWAPGLPDQEAWPAWLREPERALLEGSATPELTELPAMTRRRLDPLGRAALQAAFRAQGPEPTGPVVFASRWGEVARSVSLLTQLARGEPLSPTVFSLSVHNASSAVYSMARGDTSNYTAISAGACSAAAGVCEAVGLLADGARQALLVSVEAPLPEPYEVFESRPWPLRAWAALVERGDDVHLQATRSSHSRAVEPSEELPADLATLRFLAGHGRELSQSGWSWSRRV